MVQTPIKPLTLEAFLELPETKPASEFIQGRILQKAIPKGKHSTLQGEFVPVINAAVRPDKIARAFPELRCSFGGRSIVPDICVFTWARIPRDADGEIANTFDRAPDWTIEILPSEQCSKRVVRNILHCLDHGCEMGWIVNPDDREITVFPSNSRSRLFTLESTEVIPVPAFSTKLALTATEIFGWLGIE